MLIVEPFCATVASYSGPKHTNRTAIVHPLLNRITQVRFWKLEQVTFDDRLMTVARRKLGFVEIGYHLLPETVTIKHQVIL